MMASTFKKISNWVDGIFDKYILVDKESKDKSIVKETTTTEVAPTANSGSNSIVAASNTEVAPTTTASTGYAMPKTDWDTWYSSNQATIERDRNQGLRDAYVNRELMNKYLTNNLYEAGLDRSGIAAEYLNQSNTAYMNNMAQVNKNAQDRQMDIYNTYFTGKREEEANRNATLLDMQKAVIENAVNSKGYLSNEDIEKIYSSPQYQELNDEYKSNLDYYMNIYKGTEEAEKEYKVAKEREENINDFDVNYKNYYDIIEDSLNENSKLTSEKAKELRELIENNKGKISEDAYNTLIYKINTAVKSSQEEINEYLNEKYKNNISTDTYITINEAKPEDFGAKDNDQYVKNILNMAKNGELINGDLVCFDSSMRDQYYDIGTYGNMKKVYLYYNGRFYPAKNIKSQDLTIEPTWEPDYKTVIRTKEPK